MNGGLTQSGIEAWTAGNKRFVREWDITLIGATDSTTVNMFEDAYQAALPGVGASALTATKRTILGTSMVKSGTFYENDWMATQLALEIEASGRYNATAGQDLVAVTVANVNSFNGRTWFTMKFDDVEHDKGQYLDFPAGRGLVVSGSSPTTVTLLASGTSNGPPVADARRFLNRSKHCVPTTKPKLIVEWPSGALAMTNPLVLRATLHGYAG